MVSGDALAKWACLHAHNYAGLWVVLAATATTVDPLEVVASREDLRTLRDTIRDEHVVIRIPKGTTQEEMSEMYVKGLAAAMADQVELEGYRLRNGKLATTPNDEEGDGPPSEAELAAASEAFELGHAEGMQAGLVQGRRLAVAALEAADPTHPLLSTLRDPEVATLTVEELVARPTDEQGPPINGDTTYSGDANPWHDPSIGKILDEDLMRGDAARHAGHDGKKPAKKKPVTPKKQGAR